MPDLSGFLTSVARFFVKTCFHKKCGVFEACKKVKDFFDTLKYPRTESSDILFYAIFIRLKDDYLPL